MGLRSIIPAAGLAVTLVFGSGCLLVHTDPEGHVKSVELKVRPKEHPEKPNAPDSGVKQASASEPAPPEAPRPGHSSSFTSVLKLPGVTGPVTPATEIGVTWQHKLAYLPNPAQNGTPVIGLVGQMFLFGTGPRMPFAPADGKLTVAMYDASTLTAAAELPRLGSWTFDKEALKKLVTVDERFGKSYALFLPWPDYRPDITRVKLAVKYEPEQGYPLFAEASTVAIDTRDGSNPTTPSPGPQPVGAGGGFTSPILSPQPVPVAPAGAPIPIGGGSTPPASQGKPPDGLPPIVMTAPLRR